MTLKQFLKKDWSKLSLTEVADVFSENDITFTFLDVIDTAPQAIEYRFTGVDGMDYGFLHIYTVDEIAESEDYDEGDSEFDRLYDLLEIEYWRAASKYICKFYIGVMDEDGNYLMNWRNFGISDEEMDYLSFR